MHILKAGEKTHPSAFISIWDESDLSNCNEAFSTAQVIKAKAQTWERGREDQY